MDTVQVEVEVPRAVLSTLRVEPADFVRQMLQVAATKWYEMGVLSQTKAAQLAGVSRAEFLTLLGQFGVSPLQYEADEVLAEVDHD